MARGDGVRVCPIPRVVGNPRKHISKYPEEKRERFLSAAELRRVGEVLRGWPASLRQCRCGRSCSRPRRYLGYPMRGPTLRAETSIEIHHLDAPMTWVSIWSFPSGWVEPFGPVVMGSQASGLDVPEVKGRTGVLRPLSAQRQGDKFR